MKPFPALLVGSVVAIACFLAIRSPASLLPPRALWQQNTLSSTERIAPVWVTVEEVHQNDVLVHETLLRTESSMPPQAPFLRVQQSPTDKFVPHFENNPVW